MQRDVGQEFIINSCLQVSLQYESVLQICFANKGFATESLQFKRESINIPRKCHQGIKPFAKSAHDHYLLYCLL